MKAAIDGGSQTLMPLLASLAERARPPSLPDMPAPKPPALVLSIDQGEELFLAEGAEEAEKFLALLKDLSTAAAPDVIILVTIRSDSYERLQMAKALEGVKQDAMSLPPLPRGSYADVIEGPARRLKDTPRALKIEPALTLALLTDIEAGGAKDALPLLAFTLERLYVEYGGDGDLSLSEYDQLGRVEGSIEAAVEARLLPPTPIQKSPRIAPPGLLCCGAGSFPGSPGSTPKRAILAGGWRGFPRFPKSPVRSSIFWSSSGYSQLTSRRTQAKLLSNRRRGTAAAMGSAAGWLIEEFAALVTLENVRVRRGIGRRMTRRVLAHPWRRRLEDAVRLRLRARPNRRGTGVALRQSLSGAGRGPVN